MQIDPHASIGFPDDLPGNEAKLSIGGRLVVTMPSLKDLNNSDQPLYPVYGGLWAPMVLQPFSSANGQLTIPPSR